MANAFIPIMSGKCRAKFQKPALRRSKTGFQGLKQAIECPIPNIRGIKPDKSRIQLENQLPNSYIWATIGSVL